MTYPYDEQDEDYDARVEHDNASLEMQEFDEIQTINAQTFSPFMDDDDE